MNINKELKNAKEIMSKLNENGYDAYLVGGYVRDKILGLVSNDIDITTNATPEEVKNIFNKTVDVGIEHGTVAVLLGGGTYEVTTYRVEGKYTDYRRPDEVSFTRNLKEDLNRRDFTINALAEDKHGNIVDYFNGLNDINKKIIRTVGDSDERFNEDALRMLRAIRFVSKLGFKIDLTTLNAIINNNSNIQYISVERIYSELNKLYKGVYKKEALEYLIFTDLYKYFPFFKYCSDNVMSSILNLDLNLVEMIAYLTIKQNLSHEYKQILLTTKEREFVKDIIEMYSEIDTRDLKLIAYKYNVDVIKSLEKLELVDSNITKSLLSLKSKIQIQSKKDIEINGKEILNLLDKPSGKWLGELLNNIEEKIILGELNNNKQEILSYILK